MYLSSNSRPDIQYSVHQCACFTHFPKKTHEEAILRVCQYLQGTKDKGLLFNPTEDFNTWLLCWCWFCWLVWSWRWSRPCLCQVENRILFDLRWLWDNNPFTGSRNPVIAWRIHSHHHINNVVVRACSKFYKNSFELTWLSLSIKYIVNTLSIHLYLAYISIYVVYIYTLLDWFIVTSIHGYTGVPVYRFDYSIKLSFRHLHCYNQVGALIIVAHLLHKRIIRAMW